MKRLAFFLVGVMLAGLMLLPYSANAAITLTPSVEGLGGGTFKPLAIPSLAGNNFAATGKVLVNGKWINIPGYIPPASTAASAAKMALFSNPWLQGALIALWPSELANGDLVLKDGAWEYQVPPPPDVDPNYEYTVSANPPTGYFTTPMEACVAYLALTGCSTCSITGAYGGTCYMTNTGPGGFTNKAWTSYTSRLVSTCPAGSTGTPPNCVLTPESRPATAEDFAGLPDPSPGILGELAPQVGVPVDAPVYEPATVPVGDPYTRPDGSTAQPMAQISPASNGQVTVDVYEMPLTDPQGNPVNDPQPQDTPEPQPTDCDKYPTSVGCTDLGTPPLGEDMPHTDKPITFTPVPISANATCPAPITSTAFGQTVTIDYSGACTYASGLRPIVLAVGYLTALFIIFGVPRSAQS